MPENDELLMLALDGYIDELIAADEDGASEYDDFTFSRKSDRRMKRLVGQMRSGHYTHLTTTVRNALIAAAVAVLLITTSYAIEPDKDRIDNFIMSFSEGCASVFLNGNEKKFKKALAQAEVSYIPDGYVLSDDRSYPSMRILEFTSGEKMYSVVFCLPGNVMWFDTERGAVTVSEFDGAEYYVEYDSGDSMCLFEINGIQCVISGVFPRDEIQKIVSGIKLKK